MRKPRPHSQPDLSRLLARQIQMSSNRQNLEMELHEWVHDIVLVTKQPPEGGLHPETYLMASAKDSIDVLMQLAPLTMNVKGAGNRRTVYADVHWKRDDDGRWIVDAVCFGIAATVAATQLARQRAQKQALLEKYEQQNIKHVNLRKIAFPVERVPLDKFSEELAVGDDLVTFAIERAHEHACEDAEMLENMVEWKDMAIDVATMGVKFGVDWEKPRLPGSKRTFVETPTLRPSRAKIVETKLPFVKTSSEQLEKVAETLSAEDRALVDLLTKDPVLVRQLAEDRALHSDRLAMEAYEWIIDKGLTARGALLAILDRKMTGDQALGFAVNMAGLIPVAGPYVKMLAGMFMNIAIASDAARVTKLRSRMYVHFVAGYIGRLALIDTVRPTRRLDRKYFDLGAKTAPAPNTLGTVRVQIALLYYASKHYTNGGWGGGAYRPQVWHFPDQYIVKWTPELLGRSFATQLHTQKYLTE